MASKKRLEKPLSAAEARAGKFMEARLREDEARYQEFLATLDPRQRQETASPRGRSRPMIHIVPGPVRGRLRAPASKSHLQRLILAASLAEGESRILRPRALRGRPGLPGGDPGPGRRGGPEGRLLRIRGGGPARSRTLHCGESGFCLRAAAAVAALGEGALHPGGAGLPGRPARGHGPGARWRNWARCARPGRAAPPSPCRGPCGAAWRGWTAAPAASSSAACCWPCPGPRATASWRWPGCAAGPTCA